MKTRIFTLMVVMLLSLMGAASAYSYGYGGQGPVYGTLPYEGLSYVRYPVYHTGYLGTSSYFGFSPYNYGFGHPYKYGGYYGRGYSSYGYGHSYLSQRHFLGHGYGGGFTGHQYGARIHHFHRPLLYPGIYRTFPTIH